MKNLLPKIKPWTFALAILTLIAVATIITLNFLTQDIVRTLWLNSPVCTPPCWSNISPGQTTEDALYTLNRNPLITDIKVSEYKDINIGEIDWNWGAGSARGGRMFYILGEANQDSVIYAIVPDFGCCMSLGDIIHVYGEPDYVLVQLVRHTEFPVPEDVISNIELIWIDKGFLVDGYPKTGTEVKEDFQIDSIVFFTPTWDGFLLYKGNSGAHAVPWHGYDDSLNYVAP